MRRFLILLFLGSVSWSFAQSDAMDSSPSDSTWTDAKYLEDQLFSPSLVRGREIAWKRGAALSGRPYLARAAEEHSGPHAPWFWSGEHQGGGVLNDMMCHSVEVARFLLTRPGASRFQQHGAAQQ